MTYGNKRDYRKINIFTAHVHQGKRYFAYRASTTWSATCKEAISRFVDANPLEVLNSDVKARFSK